MAVTAPTAIDQTVAENEAAIIFLRPTTYGDAIQAPIVKVEENNAISLVGISSAWTKILHRTTPGEHTYVVGGESGSKLAATLEKGKYYYVLVDPRIGIFKARFALVPLTEQDLLKKTFRKDFHKCEWVEPAASAHAWFLDNTPSLREKASTAEKKFTEAKPEDRMIITPLHGVANPVAPL